MHRPGGLRLSAENTINDHQPAGLGAMTGSASATPETDALAGEWIACETVPASHARKLERERDDARRNAEVERLSGVAVVAICQRQEAEIERLNKAIRLTLEENAHLADGDNCTLLRLKRAYVQNAEAVATASTKL